MVAKSALNQLVVLRELRAGWWFSERSKQIGGSQSAPSRSAVLRAIVSWHICLTVFCARSQLGALFGSSRDLQMWKLS